MASITIVDGLTALVSAVSDYFKAQGISATVKLGWKERWRQDNQGPGGASRVIFIPGKMPPEATSEPAALEAGTLTEARIQRDNPRPLAWWHKTVTLSIWAVDNTAPSDEGKQYAATVALFELTMQAMRRAVFTDSAGLQRIVGVSDNSFRDLQWVLPPLEMGFGRELFCYFEQNGPIYDAVADAGTASTGITRGPFL